MLSSNWYIANYVLCTVELNHFNYKCLGIGIQYCILNAGSFHTVRFHYHLEDYRSAVSIEGAH